jgi:CRP-like cAMP-binding protein
MNGMGKTENYTACTVSVRHCRCFEKLTDEEKILLDENSVIVEFKKGEVICKQGAYVSHVLYMESGLAKVSIESQSNSLILKLVPDRNFIGLSNLTAEQSTNYYSAKAYIDSVVRQIDIKFFRQLIAQNPQFSMELFDILSSNTLQIYGRFYCLTQKQAYGRLADIILCLSERVFKANQFSLPLTRKDLAELSGMSAETVIRMLNKFIDEGLIKMEGKEFEVLNHERLSQISEKG